MPNVVDAKAGNAGCPSDLHPSASEIAGLQRRPKARREDEVAIAVRRPCEQTRFGLMPAMLAEYRDRIG